MLDSSFFAMVNLQWTILLTTTLMVSNLLPPLVVVALMVSNSTATLAMDQGLEPGRVHKCGDVDVPYPFGIGDDKRCYK